MGVIGQHWGRFYRSRLGRGGEWEGIFLWRNTHRPKMVDNVYSSTWGRGMSAGAFKQRCTKTINRHGTHTHTHTGEHACNAM